MDPLILKFFLLFPEVERIVSACFFRGIVVAFNGALLDKNRRLPIGIMRTIARRSGWYIYSTGQGYSIRPDTELQTFITYPYRETVEAIQKQILATSFKKLASESLRVEEAYARVTDLALAAINPSEEIPGVGISAPYSPEALILNLRRKEACHEPHIT